MIKVKSSQLIKDSFLCIIVWSLKNTADYSQMFSWSCNHDDGGDDAIDDEQGYGEKLKKLVKKLNWM